MISEKDRSSERNLDFDTVINRRNTRSIKYDSAKSKGYPEDVLPLWVADMDFKTSSFVEDALIELSRHNIYGYSETYEGDGFFEAVAGWMEERHGFKVRPEWMVKTPGVCFAISVAVRALTSPGESVLIQQPVYYPFSSIVRHNGRKLISSDLRYDGEGHYDIDFEDFEKKIRENDVKLFILCSPHNPVGRIWTEEELFRMGEICRSYGVLVFSDEIHFDFTWKRKHSVFQETDPSFKEFTITATAPSKTFNLAGLQQSNIFIPDEKIRKRFQKEYRITGAEELNIFGITAAEAAYRYGGVWYEAMCGYVKDNILFARDFIKENLPGVILSDTEGTYLLWLDFTGTKIPPEDLDRTIIQKAGLWLDDGALFGQSGLGFQRINAACPRSILKDALERLIF